VEERVGERRFHYRYQAPLSGSLPAGGEREKKSRSMGGFMVGEKNRQRKAKITAE
jgi:hypothetical protein